MDRFPDMQSFQETLFGKLRNYFESFEKNSSIYFDKKTNRAFYKILSIDSENFTSLTSQIIRQRTDDQLVEDISYFFENGNSFTYQIIKKGAYSFESLDQDLLKMHFVLNDETQFYQISIPSAKILLTQKLSAGSSHSSLTLGLMEFNLQIEQLYQEHEAHLNYLYFFKDMPSPQSSLMVRVLENNDQWSPYQFFYASSFLGEVTPNQFFLGLSQGTQVFTNHSAELVKLIHQLGFPKLSGED
jgi:hypothetical protein